MVQEVHNFGGNYGLNTLDMTQIFELWGENNDIDVVDHSPTVANLLNGVASDLKFEVNDNVYF
jgi:hypothetical protein